MDRVDSDDDYEFNPKPKHETPDPKKDMNYWNKLEFELENTRKLFFKPPEITFPKNWNSKSAKPLDFFFLIEFFQK